MTRSIRLPRIGTHRAWRDAARRLLAEGVPPAEVVWNDGANHPDLFAFDAALPEGPMPPAKVPKSFVALADSVIWHHDPERFALCYRLLWRLRAERGLMADRGDALVARLRGMEKAVHRCQHKMRAFVRFRELPPTDAGRRRFAAWFEPTHHTIEPNAAFFRNRFGDMDWQIVTPDVSVACADGALRFSLDAPRPDLPEDANEDLWRTYFRNIFNPARLKTQAMCSEMPRKYWKNMPEAREIPDLIANAPARAREMAEQQASLPNPRLAHWCAAPADLAQGLQACRRCAIGCAATQAVPGEGPDGAPLMIVGEQPGDAEDLAGRPFVGPAGQLLDTLLDETGIDRKAAFLTNAVKHFKYTVRGKRRIHQRPGAGEVQHCRWWLDEEIRRVQPSTILGLGATALHALTGTPSKLDAARGRVLTGPEGIPIVPSYHPAYILRAPSAADRSRARDALSADLRRAARAAGLV